MPRDLNRSPEGSAEHKQTMRYWIGRALQDLRLEHDGRLDDVRDAIRLMTGNPPPSSPKLIRMEEGAYNRRPGTGWPSGEITLDEIVAAYAHLFLSEDADSRDIWRMALSRWVEEGSAPRARLETPAVASVREAVQARLRIRRANQQDDAESQETPTSTPRRRKAQ